MNPLGCDTIEFEDDRYYSSFMIFMTLSSKQERIKAFIGFWSSVMGDGDALYIFIVTLRIYSDMNPPCQNGCPLYHIIIAESSWSGFLLMSIENWPFMQPNPASALIELPAPS